MEGEQERTEKERKPTNQPVTGVHGEKDEGGFGLRTCIHNHRTPPGRVLCCLAAVSEPVGKQFLDIWNHGCAFLQLAGRQFNVPQLFANRAAAFCLGPLLAFGQLQIRTCIHNHRAPSEWVFCRPAALKNLEIRQDSCDFFLQGNKIPHPSGILRL